MKAEHLLKSGTVAQAYTQPYVVDPAYYHTYAAQYAQQRVPYQQTPYWDGQADQNKERRPYRGGGGVRRTPGAHGAAQPAGAAVPAVGQQPGQAAPHGGRPRGNSHGQGQAPFKGDGTQPSGGKGRGRKNKKSSEAKPAVVSNGTHITPSGNYTFFLSSYLSQLLIIRQLLYPN